MRGCDLSDAEARVRLERDEALPYEAKLNSRCRAAECSDGLHSGVTRGIGRRGFAQDVTRARECSARGRTAQPSGHGTCRWTTSYWPRKAPRPEAPRQGAHRRLSYFAEIVGGKTGEVRRANRKQNFGEAAPQPNRQSKFANLTGGGGGIRTHPTYEGKRRQIPARVKKT